jgi:hypothetical protein
LKYNLTETKTLNNPYMATFNNGILGGFSGKVGTVVGVTQGDKHYMRSLPRPRKKYTQGELLNQAQFKMVQAHLQPVKELVKAGYKDYYTPGGGYRAAFAYTRKMAVVTDDAGSYIDPALFKISGGELAGAADPTVALEGGLLSFNWETSTVTQFDGADQMMILVYDAANFRAVTRIFNGAYRHAGESSIQLPAAFNGTEVDIYIGFVAADRSAQSDSQYLGRMLI